MKNFLLSLIAVFAVLSAFAQDDSLSATATPTHVSVSEQIVEPTVELEKNNVSKLRKRYPVKKHNLGVEFNVMFVMVPINFVYEYNFLPWFSAGAGAGVVVSYGILGADWLVRLGFTAFPKRKVSPFLRCDFGGTYTYNFFNSDRPTEYMSLVVPMAGIDIKQRRGGKLSVGVGLPWLFLSDAFPMPLPNLRIGYVF